MRLRPGLIALRQTPRWIKARKRREEERMEGEGSKETGWREDGRRGQGGQVRNGKGTEEERVEGALPHFLFYNLTTPRKHDRICTDCFFQRCRTPLRTTSATGQATVATAAAASTRCSSITTASHRPTNTVRLCGHYHSTRPPAA